MQTKSNIKLTLHKCQPAIIMKLMNVKQKPNGTEKLGTTPYTLNNALVKSHNSIADLALVLKILSSFPPICTLSEFLSTVLIVSFANSEKKTIIFMVISFLQK